MDGLPSVDLAVVQPDILQEASKWDAAVQVKRQQLLNEKNRHIPSRPTQKKNSKTDALGTDVRIVDKKFLEQTYHTGNESSQNIIDCTVKDFSLNTDQERAFRIIANHASSSNSEKLSMYLGGMGGTGKSQVIKALMHFFRTHNEEHRFMILAPTGSAAAFLNGSTYHSALGINDRRQLDSAKNLAQV